MDGKWPRRLRQDLTVDERWRVDSRPPFLEVLDDDTKTFAF